MNEEFSAENKPEKVEILSLILVPARELAGQVYRVLGQFEEIFPWLNFNLAVGGAKIDTDIELFKEKGCNVLVGTVGRIWDMLERKEIDLKSLKVFVIDEADLILEMGN